MTNQSDSNLAHGPSVPLCIPQSNFGSMVHSTAYTPVLAGDRLTQSKSVESQRTYDGLNLTEDDDSGGVSLWGHDKEAMDMHDEGTNSHMLDTSQHPGSSNTMSESQAPDCLEYPENASGPSSLSSLGGVYPLTSSIEELDPTMLGNDEVDTMSESTGTTYESFASMDDATALHELVPENPQAEDESNGPSEGFDTEDSAANAPNATAESDWNTFLSLGFLAHFTAITTANSGSNTLDEEDHLHADEPLIATLLESQSSQNNTKNKNFRLFLDHWLCAYREELQADRWYFPAIGTKGDKDWPYLSQRPHDLAIETGDLDEKTCDFQGINWEKIGVSRTTAREVRRMTYVNMVNCLPHNKAQRDIIGGPLFKASCFMNDQSKIQYAGVSASSQNYFRFRRFNARHQVPLSHFQLRHIMAASSKNSVFFPVHDPDHHWLRKISCINPEDDSKDYIMDVSSDLQKDELGVTRISTIAASDGILAAGGFDGDYVFKPLDSSPDHPFSSGTITEFDDPSTNHIHTFLDRRSGLPQVVFSSNDRFVRTLDATTNTFVQEHYHGTEINCAATSPDTRLRLLVGDCTRPALVEADSGKLITGLGGHSDYGFACDWAPDGIHMATGAQDGMVLVWDVRDWRAPLKTLTTEIGGVRTLKFSPAGGGKRVLVMAESADFVHVVDGDTFDSKQSFDLFAEIGGISFLPDGSQFFALGCDDAVGGLLAFERAGYGERDWRHAEPQSELDYLDEEDVPNEWVRETEMEDDARVKLSWNGRRRRGLGLGELVI
ncbi:MAG: hypothetical protein LQ351_004883 [Letrouitia transgressa]|nr:MAG: hypothetical protein LQ351_004883 [Letrouitia transgressa]